jgi:WD40 repeat protein
VWTLTHKIDVDTALSSPSSSSTISTKTVSSLLSGKWSLQPFAKLSGHSAAIESVDINREGQLVCTGSWDHTLKLWDLRALPSSSSFPSIIEETNVESSTSSPTPAIAAAATTATTTTTKKRRRITTTESEIPTLRCVLTLNGHKGPVSCVRWLDSDPNFVVSSSLDVSVRVWDVGSGLNTFVAHTPAPVRSLDVLSSSTPSSETDVRNSASHPLLLVTAHTDRTLRVWDLRLPSSSTAAQFTLTPTHSFVAPKSWPSNVCWLPHTNVPLFAATDYAGTLRVWDLRSSIPLASLIHVHSTVTTHAIPETTTTTTTTTTNNTNNNNIEINHTTHSSSLNTNTSKTNKILSLTTWWTQHRGIQLATGGTDNRLILHHL